MTTPGTPGRPRPRRHLILATAALAASLAAQAAPVFVPELPEQEPDIVQPPEVRVTRQQRRRQQQLVAKRRRQGR